MSGVTANGLVELRKPNPSLNTVLELEFPGGVERLCEADQPLGSATLGNYIQRIRKVPVLDYGVPNFRSSLTGLTVRITIDDHDGRFSALNQQYGQSLNGCRARLRWASSNLTPAAAWDTPDDWIPLGRFVFDGMDVESVGVRSLRLRTDDLPLQRALNLPAVTPFSSPNTATEAVSKVLPVVYGMHDSRALSGTVAGTTGALPCVYLGNIPGLGYCYSPSAGSMYHVNACFVNGVFTSSANWSRSDQRFPGALATVIAFAADQGNAAITCDGYGLHPGATGFVNLADPAPYTNGVAILRHILSNWCYRGWRYERTWYGDSVLPIDTASWDAATAYVTRQRSRSGIRLTGAETGAGLIASMCRSEGLRAEWCPTGLALRTMDHAETNVYRSGPAWINSPATPDISGASDTREATDAIIREYWHMGTTGARSRVTVVRPGCTVIRSIDTHDTPWGNHRRFLDRGMLKSGVTMSLSASWLGLDGSTPSLKDGSTVSTWNDVTDGFRTAYNMSAGNAPTLKTGIVNGRPVLRFNGSTNYLVGTTSSNLMTTSDFTIYVVFRATAITTSAAAPEDNHGLVCDANAYWGLYLKVSAGLYYLVADVYDGAHRQVSTQIALNTWYVARAAHRSGVLYLSIDNWTQVSVAAGAVVSLANAARIGRSLNNQYLNGDVAEVAIFNTGDIAAQGALSGFPGGGGQFEMFRMLSDEYGIN